MQIGIGLRVCDRIQVIGVIIHEMIVRIVSICLSIEQVSSGVVGSHHELSHTSHEVRHLLVSGGLPLKKLLSSFTRKTGLRERMNDKSRGDTFHTHAYFTVYFLYQHGILA
jgi:hypothetical protein